MTSSPKQSSQSKDTFHSPQDTSVRDTDTAAMRLPHNPDFDNGRWFPTWRSYQGECRDSCRPAT